MKEIFWKLKDRWKLFESVGRKRLFKIRKSGKRETVLESKTIRNIRE
jgi:hypothetical protein